MMMCELGRILHDEQMENNGRSGLTKGMHTLKKERKFR